ncbi:MAG: ABC transporter permease [Candidatus Bathyarchaeia archaeon]
MSYRTVKESKTEKVKSFLMAYILPTLTLLAMVVLWEISVWALKIPIWLLPAPSLVANKIVSYWPYLSYNLFITFYETILGFITAIIIALPLSIAITYSRVLQNIIYPILLLFQSVPKQAIAPIVVLWFGLGITPKIVIAFLVAFFVIIVDTTTGLMTAPPELIDIAKLLKAKKSQIYLKIRLPHSLPFLFSGLKTAITLSVVGAVIGEFVASDMGAGYVILASAPQLNTDMAFASIILLSIMSMALFALVHIIERLTIPWAFRARH